MKHYVKPTVEIYELSGNEAICGGCTNKLRDNTNLNALLAMSFPGADSNNDMVLSEAEAKNLFGIGESCSIQIESYCKFTSTGMNVSWS